MQDFMKWTLEAIRREGQAMSWMEDRRMEWAPLLASRLGYLLNGASFVLITDKEREWFERYFLQNINKVGALRPFLPFISLRSLYPDFDAISSKEQIALLNDMLSISFSTGFIYFYIGRSDDRRATIAKSNENSYMWLFDEQAPNSFYLSSDDENLDIKLISLFKLFDRSINATLFSKVSL